jgi:hypothetical protein
MKEQKEKTCLNETTQRCSFTRAHILAVGQGDLIGLCASDFVLREMQIHLARACQWKELEGGDSNLISVKVGVIGGAVCVMHSNDLLRAAQHAHQMAHDARLVKRRLPIHKQNVSVHYGSMRRAQKHGKRKHKRFVSKKAYPDGDEPS